MGGIITNKNSIDNNNSSGNNNNHDDDDDGDDDDDADDDDADDDDDDNDDDDRRLDIFFCQPKKLAKSPTSSQIPNSLRQLFGRRQKPVGFTLSHQKHKQIKASFKKHQRISASFFDDDSNKKNQRKSSLKERAFRLFVSTDQNLSCETRAHLKITRSLVETCFVFKQIYTESKK